MFGTLSASQRRRTVLLFVCVLLAMAGLGGRVGYIQFALGDKLREEALEVRLRDIPVSARRGAVYDRNGRELALSVTVDSVYAVPAEIASPEETARILAAALSLDVDSVLTNITRKTSFVWVKRQIEEEEAKHLRELQLQGIGFTQESRRYYPKGNLASHILGFAGIDSQGLEGIEVSLDRELRGTNGRIVVEYDARGRELPHAVHRHIPAVDGLDLVLTIDEVIQYIVERELDLGMERTNAQHGVVIVLDPRTGEILGMASRPDYDPNQYASYPQDNWRNTAISDTFCPGSTFKPITAAAAIDAQAVSWNSRFNCGGSYAVPGAVIGCVGGHGNRSMAEILIYSCNVGFIQVGLKLGFDNFYRYAEAFGLMDKTGIDLPGEGVGLFPPRERAKVVDLAVMSFGQTLTLTPLQLISALSVIPNHGTLMRPLIARELRGPDGEVVRTFDPEPVRQVVSRETADEVASVMAEVVVRGTGKRAQLDQHTVGGKTGTAQKVIGGRVVHGRYVGYFYGFAPVSDPRIAVLCLFDDPVGSYYGGTIAAPVVNAVMKDVLRYLEVPPDKGEVEETPDTIIVPWLVNLSQEDAAMLAEEMGIGLRFAGSGERVVSQTPPGGTEVERGSTAVAELGRQEPSIAGERITVPDVRGMGVRQAAELLGLVGLGMIQDGSGQAISQDPAPGARVPPKTPIRVVFGAGP